MKRLVLVVGIVVGSLALFAGNGNAATMHAVRDVPPPSNCHGGNGTYLDTATGNYYRYDSLNTVTYFCTYDNTAGDADDGYACTYAVEFGQYGFDGYAKLDLLSGVCYLHYRNFPTVCVSNDGGDCGSAPYDNTLGSWDQATLEGDYSSSDFFVCVDGNACTDVQELKT